MLENALRKVQLKKVGGLVALLSHICLRKFGERVAHLMNGEML